MQCVSTSSARTECGMSMMCCMSLLAVLRRNTDVCKCDVFSVVNVYLDLEVVCIYGRMYVCCNECNVLSNECDDPTPCLVHTVEKFCVVEVIAGCEYMGGTSGSGFVFSADGVLEMSGVKGVGEYM